MLRHHMRRIVQPSCPPKLLGAYIAIETIAASFAISTANAADRVPIRRHNCCGAKRKAV
jgi:hypothetical protein